MIFREPVVHIRLLCYFYREKDLVIMIRPATPEDAAALTEIYNHYILTTTVTFETEALRPGQMRRRIEEISAEGPYFVHESGGRVDGYCYAHRLGQRAAYEGSMELSLYLTPSGTGKGIGSALMERMVEECRRRAYRALFCLVTSGNMASAALCSKFGFEKVGCLKAAGFKSGRTLDLDYYELLL